MRAGKCRWSAAKDRSPAAALRRSKIRPVPGRSYFGAGEGNRTLVVSLEGFCSTIELHPPVGANALCHCRRTAVNRDRRNHLPRQRLNRLRINLGRGSWRHGQVGEGRSGWHLSRSRSRFIRRPRPASRSLSTRSTNLRGSGCATRKLSPGSARSTAISLDERCWSTRRRQSSWPWVSRDTGLAPGPEPRSVPLSSDATCPTRTPVMVASIVEDPPRIRSTVGETKGVLK